MQNLIFFMSSYTNLMTADSQLWFAPDGNVCSGVYLCTCDDCLNVGIEEEWTPDEWSLDEWRAWELAQHKLWLEYFTTNSDKRAYRKLRQSQDPWDAWEGLFDSL
jgi:hypothetical protein